MKALALWQPWVGFVAAGLKTIETRWWDTKYRGDVLFCATKGTSRDYNSDVRLAFKLADIEYTNTWLTMTPPVNRLIEPRGVMMCVAEIVDCRPCVVGDEKQACAPVVYEDIVPGKQGLQLIYKFGFILENVRLVKQKPVKCGRKWFLIDDAEIEYV